MREQPPVSIFIVTCLDSEVRCDILRRTCENALAQRYPVFEVVVSDNAGRRSAAEALKDLRDPRLKVVAHTENVGFTGNINRCLALCSHDIIKPLCDDDLLHPDFLAVAVPLVDDDTLVVAGVEKFLVGQSPAAANVAINAPPEVECREAGYDRGVWTLPYDACCIPSATLFTRKLFRDLGGYDPATVTSDWDFFVEACLHRRVAYIKHVLCFVGVWEGSLTEEMTARPYFFPREALYTKFRVYHCKNLSPRDRAALLRTLFKELFVQGTRVVKHWREARYYAGYRGYVRRFCGLFRQARGRFGKRPLQL